MFDRCSVDSMMGRVKKFGIVFPEAAFFCRSYIAKGSHLGSCYMMVEELPTS